MTPLPAGPGGAEAWPAILPVGQDRGLFQRQYGVGPAQKAMTNRPIQQAMPAAQNSERTVAVSARYAVM